MTKPAMKKLLLVILIMSLFVLSACSFSDSAYKSESEYINIESNRILDSLNNHNREEFVNLFSVKARSSLGFNDKVDRILDLYRSDEFISATIPSTASGEKSWGDGGVDEWSIMPDVFAIHTISNDELSYEYVNDRFYQFTFNYYIVNISDTDLEGLTYLKFDVCNRTSETIQIGED